MFKKNTNEIEFSSKNFATSHHIVGVGNLKLEINTMFDFHTRVALKPMKSAEMTKRSSAAAGTGNTNSYSRGKYRRSSVAVMAGGSAAILTMNKERHYFESHHLNLHTCMGASINYVDNTPDLSYKKLYGKKILELEANHP